MTFPMPIHFLTLIDPSVGRIEKASMSEQTIMEILLSNFDDTTIFRDSDGIFVDIAEWEGVTVNETGEVTCIEWEQEEAGMALFDSGENDYLDESFPQPGGSIDLKWIPSSVELLHIPGLLLKGTMDTAALPSCLKTLDVDRNALEGPFETKLLPRALEVIHATQNKLSGSVDLLSLPSKLVALFLGQNRLSGTLDFSNLPPTIQYLILQQNAFNGTLDLSCMPHKILTFKIDGNRFESQASLTVRKGYFGNWVLDAGTIGEIFDTDGKPVRFAPNGSKSIRIVQNV